ncbi:hypothetical protein [Herbaspirillum rubrisubalbicans]|uniref:hypothetical protein n=1 Tax=Herbaspirillum rubrisubalbicans TaxID=80842 RepID=UPI001EEABEF9|nr:hypothetical protein [Herbaspirillum rubrisubalbicans]
MLFFAEDIDISIDMERDISVRSDIAARRASVGTFQFISRHAVGIVEGLHKPQRSGAALCRFIKAHRDGSAEQFSLTVDQAFQMHGAAGLQWKIFDRLDLAFIIDVGLDLDLIGEDLFPVDGVGIAEAAFGQRSEAGVVFVIR